MTAKEPTAETDAELVELRKTNAEKDQTIGVLNGIVAEYQQMHADAVMQAATYKTQLARLSAAAQ